jgi:hypothetical protein
LTPQNSKLEGTIASLEGKEFITIQFTNATCQTVRVYWLDYGGQRVLYNTLQPHSAYVQGSWQTHPWVIADESDRALMLFIPDPTTNVMEAYVSSGDIFRPLPPPVLPKNGPRSFPDGPYKIELCEGIRPPAGYILVDTEIAMSTCGTPGRDYGLTFPMRNIWWRYVHESVGSILWVCKGQTPPVGWVRFVMVGEEEHSWACKQPFADRTVNGAVSIRREF